MFNTQSRSQVGIGTLIVFIAMVLVAAIASGVLIQTAGLLQEQASQTGEETTSEVSDLIQVKNVVALEKRNFPSLGSSVENNVITHLNVSVGLASGSDPVNLSEASYAIESSNSAGFVNGNPNSEDAITFFRLQSIKKNVTILSEQNDVMVVRFNLTKIESVDPLKENEKLTIYVNSPAGATSTEEVSSPKKIKEEESYTLK